jgi:hypothetical protein
MLSFHAAPVVGDEFPCGGKAGLASRFLPLVDAVFARFFERSEFRLGPMRTVFDGLTHASELKGLVKMRQGSFPGVGNVAAITGRRERVF